MRVPAPTAIALICALAFPVVGGGAHATEITVCSSGCDYTAIQDAVDNATPGDTLLLGPETFYEHAHIEKDLIVQGAGPEQTIVDGGGSGGSVFEICGWGDCVLTSVTLAGMTIQNGRAFHGGGVSHYVGQLKIENCHIRNNRTTDEALPHWGGGIFSCGNLRVSNSTISGNRADAGGGIGMAECRDAGPLEITNTTISDNRDGGVAIDYWSDPVVTISNSTVTNNTYLNWGGSCGGAGGLFTCSVFPVTLMNTIVAGNEGPQCAGGVTSGGHNLSSDSSCDFTRGTDLQNTDPLLLPLADNGGPTHTCALQPSSPAIDAGGSRCETTDQRGVSRPYDGDGHGGARCDIGAYEYFSVPVSVIPQIYDLVLALAGADREVVAPLQDAIQTLQDSDSSNDGEAVGHLQAFITEVEERSNQALTDAEADELIAEAERIIAIERVSVREEMGGLTN